MKNYRLFLLSFVTVSCIFLSGFKKSFAEDQSVRVEAKPKSDVKLTRPNTNKSEEKQTLQNYLDLSLPFDNSGRIDSGFEQQSQLENPESNLFTPEPKKNTQSLQLRGGWLMSQEPEAEKRKSVDGAGIYINVKP